LLAAGAEPLARAAAASREIARLPAVVATSLAELARCRPASLFDRQPGEQGAMSAATRAARPAALTEVSEWAVDEVAPTLRISGTAANVQLEESVVLVERLPRTHTMLADGALSPAHVRQLVAIVGPVADDALRADVKAHVLGLLEGETPPQLGDCARRIVLRRDAEAAGRKLVAAVRERGVRLHDRRDGTGTVAIDLPLPVCAAIYRSLEAHAEQARVEGTKQQRMADCLADLVLRPGEHGLPPVTIALTLVATLETMLGGSEPGQVEGRLVSAETVRELAYSFGLLPRPAPDLDGLPGEPGGAEAVPTGPDPDHLTPTSPPTPAPADEGAQRPVGPASPAGPEPGATPVGDRPLSEWMALAAQSQCLMPELSMPASRMSRKGTALLPRVPPAAGEGRRSAAGWLGSHRAQHRRRRRAGDPRLARKPHRGGRGRPRRRDDHPGRRAQRRLHRRLRGGGAARRW
jgi:hypothetical protein